VIIHNASKNLHVFTDWKSVVILDLPISLNILYSCNVRISTWPLYMILHILLPYSEKGVF